MATAPPVVTSQPITALLWRYGDAETRLRETLAELYRELGRRGMNVGSTGNVSARTDDGMLITPSGVRVDTVAGERLVRCRFDGSYDGPLLPSSEWEMHAAIYRQAPKAQVIVHTHSDYATALACLGQPLPGFHYAVAEFGGDDIRCAPYATFGTPALADLAAEAINGRTACLLANHGMICHGRAADTALLAAIRLEGLARQYLIARTAGTCATAVARGDGGRTDPLPDLRHAVGRWGCRGVAPDGWRRGKHQRHGVRSPPASRSFTALHLPRRSMVMDLAATA